MGFLVVVEEEAVTVMMRMKVNGFKNMTGLHQ
jgi:hypothetical protein